ncbi:MAG: tetraacyldisaccharide 4'-kinase [Mucinivorans sp.]
MRNILTAPLSWLYAAGVALRHAMFNIGLYKVEEFDIPIVVVGNITVGGTGKTPFTEYLVEQLSTDYHVAVLSRGYMRKTKGFVLASETSSFKNVGDEPKQIKLKFPSIPVAVCEKRVVGIKKLRELHPEVNLIILDDAFQHRHVEGWVNIVLMDYNCPAIILIVWREQIFS